MSKITGTVSITGQLSRKDTDDNYPLVHQNDIKGGYRILIDESEMSQIPIQYLEDGMKVLISNNDKEFIYKNGGWEEYIGNPDAVEVHIGPDEPIQEHIKVWIDDSDESGKEITNFAEIDDDEISLGKTWSSEKIDKQIKGIIDDDVTTTDKTWSSDKINRIAEGIKSYAVSFNNDEKILTLIKFNNYHTEYDDETFTVLIKK